MGYQGFVMKEILAATPQSVTPAQAGAPLLFGSHRWCKRDSRLRGNDGLEMD